MAYFPDTMPRPVPNMDDAGFWSNCRDKRLAFQACSDCGHLRHPPTPICRRCCGTAVKWVEAPDRAEVFTFTVVHHASHPAVSERLPYVCALVTFPDLPGVKLVSNITGCAPEAIRIGMALRIWWDDIGDGMYVPRFEPRDLETER